MNGDTCNWGGVGSLRGVPGAAAAARLVLDHVSHSLLVGSQASDFASSFGGLETRSLSSNASEAAFASWCDATVHTAQRDTPHSRVSGGPRSASPTSGSTCRRRQPKAVARSSPEPRAA